MGEPPWMYVNGDQSRVVDLDVEGGMRRSVTVYRSNYELRASVQHLGDGVETGRPSSWSIVRSTHRKESSLSSSLIKAS